MVIEIETELSVQGDPKGDIGLSTNDVVAIKNAVLKAFMDGTIVAGEAGVAVKDIIGAFIDLDNQAIARDEALVREKERLTAEKK